MRAFGKALLSALEMAVLLSAPCAAQTVPPQAIPGVPAQQLRQLAELQAAQAAARRPGDDKLGCDELQVQLTEVVNDPALKAKIESAGAAAQRQMEAVEKAQAVAAGSTAVAAAASIAPGGQWAALGAAMAQAEAAKAGAAGKMQQNMALAQSATEMMPKLMRGQRLIELAKAKQCEWAAGVLPAGFVNANPMNPNPESDR